MVAPQTTYVIDAEFAFVGPIAFDVAKFIFDLLLSYFALEGHAGGMCGWWGCGCGWQCGCWCC